MKSIKKSKLVFLLIDMQVISVYGQDGLYPKDRKRIIPAQLEALRFCAEYSIPLVVLEYTDHGETIPELAAEINKLPKKIKILKKSYNGFENPLLKKYLRKIKAETLVLMGVNANICVETTGTAAIQLGFRIASAKTLISGYREEINEDWYKKNGLYHRSHKTLLKKLGEEY